jgi:site-specific DNA-methyltransferase (adenine-specific)
MQIVDKNIEELIPYSKNPRKNDEAVEAVANSIKEFGFKVPIVIDGENNVVCGHTRLKAAKKLKMDSVPCVIADDLTEEQIKAFRLADNKVGELAEWDFDLLDEELDGIFDIDMSDFGFEQAETVGFDEKMLDELFTDAPEKEKNPKKIQCPHCGEWFEIE